MYASSQYPKVTISLQPKPFFNNELSIWFGTMNLGWLIVHIKGSQVNFGKLDVLLSLKIVFILTYSAVTDEMLFLTFILGLQFTKAHF